MVFTIGLLCAAHITKHQSSIRAISPAIGASGLH
jgi:hypothetical protein